MTELFKCRKSGTKCCAPKSLIKEALGQKEESTHKVSTQANVDHTTVSALDTSQGILSYQLILAIRICFCSFRTDKNCIDDCQTSDLQQICLWS
jgi:hypothetical protein